MTPVKVIVTERGKEREPLIIEGTRTEQITSYTPVYRVPGGEIVVRAKDFLMQSIGELAFRTDDFILEVEDREIAKVPRDYYDGNQLVELVRVDTSAKALIGPRATIRRGDIEISIEVFRREKRREKI